MLDGEHDEAGAIEATKVATRRFVRRQRAWFRRDPRIRWMAPDGDLVQQGMAALASK
jgi:tRNA dimethylallyltransferase